MTRPKQTPNASQQLPRTASLLPSVRRSSGLTIAFLTLCLVACGDDVPPPGDATVVPDADAALRPDADSGTRPDADATVNTPDAEPSEVVCESQVFPLGIDPISRLRPVSSAVTSRGFVFGWGDRQGVQEEARIGEIANGTVTPMLQQVTNSLNSARSVQASDGYAIWLDDGATGEHQIVTGASVTSTDPNLRSISAATGQHSEPKLFKVADGRWVAAWLRSDAGNQQIQMRLLTADALEAIVTLPYNLTTKQFGMSFSDERLYLTWSEQGNVQVAVVGLDGAELTSPTAMTEHGYATEDVAISFDQGFGAVVYGVLVESVRYELRSRLLDSDGIAVRPSQVVSNPPLKGRTPQMAAFARGYVVAYQASDRDQSETLHLAFIHGSDGDVVEDYDLGPGNFDGQRAGISVDSNGQLGVGWASVERVDGQFKTVLRAARLTCPDAWLACGVMP